MNQSCQYHVNVAYTMMLRTYKFNFESDLAFDATELNQNINETNGALERVALGFR